MKEKILDKQVLRYVIATTVSGKPTYLKKKLQKIEYSFVTDIDDATKCSSFFSYPLYAASRTYSKLQQPPCLRVALLFSRITTLLSSFH